MFWSITIILFIFFGQYSAQRSLKSFDDTVVFDINWLDKKLNDDLENLESIIVTSSHKEKYKCFLPRIHEEEGKEGLEKYEGPSALELISPLFSQSFCSYRLESYWTYEVCHGKYIRQYHEDREGKKTKVQEYFLGKWDESEYKKLLNNFKENEQDKGYVIPVKKIENVNLPYIELTMGNGTVCDLNNNKPRETKVLYVCYAHGKHDVYSLKETSICQYEIIILSSLLCAHPKYKPKDSGQHQINCTPLEDGTSKPYNLIKLEKESKKLQKQTEFDSIRIEFTPIDLTEREPKKSSENLIVEPVESFLSGKKCLSGGTGWWRYEFCYGRYIEQYHIEKDGSKTSINLGKFIRENHINWLKERPQKRPKPLNERKQLSYLYSNGDICDKTGKPRQTEVKLKCLENSSNLNTVSLYLLEPKYCEYILGVESPLICKILSRADDNGFVSSNDYETDIIVE